MLQDAHSRKISNPVEAPTGDTIVVAAVAGEWHYIHELIGDLSAAGTVEILAINEDDEETSFGEFDLGDGQGLTLQDEPGEDNRPRFELKPGEDFVLRVTGATFKGSVHWSIRN
jgi:hypothetical protein